MVLSKLVWTLGFLEGIFFAVGVNPENEMVKSFLEVLAILDAPIWARILLLILPFLALIITIKKIHRKWGDKGMAAVIFGFLGGLVIIDFPIFGFLALIVGLYLAKNFG